MWGGVSWGVCWEGGRRGGGKYVGVAGRTCVVGCGVEGHRLGFLGFGFLVLLRIFGVGRVLSVLMRIALFVCLFD